MIPNNHTIMYFKFNENRWIQKIQEGELSFSCAGAFILQAKRTGNYVQGDELEGVFARLHNSNPKIIEMRNKLGDDLEEIADGDFTFLRRESAKVKPIFCVFSYTAENVLQDGKIAKPGTQVVRFNFDQRMYDGFVTPSAINVVSDSHRFTLSLFQPKPFIDKVEKALLIKQKPYKVERINYIPMSQGEFFIEPTDDYRELFTKSKNYKYQHEERICLIKESFRTESERYLLHVGRFNKEDYFTFHDVVNIEITGNFVKV